jgi:beta-N-acetylhexosaminidase
MKKNLVLVLLFVAQYSFGQINTANLWADSVYNSLSETERIGQLMVVRLSAMNPQNKVVTFYDDKITDLIKQYNIGGICVFQGSPVKQANIINALQAKAKTPLMMCIDAEWGVGMRIIDSVLPLPKQMMLGAMQDEKIVYEYGKIVANQCKRMGIQVNYAPVVDVNNNPNNPVINDRSFGEDKYKVANYGIQYMKGMQDNGVMACAKHFPGHGDVAVDSHLDLPVINKTMAQLDSLELYPFRQIFKAGIGSVMIAHLFIPAIDNTANKATSLSKNNVTNLMRNQIGYQGLTFTDGLEMQGVQKFFPNGEAAVQSIIAGNDMLCVPADVPLAVLKIKEAIKNKQLNWADIEYHCKRVLLAKYQYGLNKLIPINTQNLTADLNKDVIAMRKTVADNAITLLNKTDESFFPLVADTTKNKIACVAVGVSSSNAFTDRMSKEYNADIFYFDYKQDASKVAALVKLLKRKYEKVVIGIHNYSRVPANNFGLSKPAIDVVKKIQQKTTAITFVFGNPYAIKNWCGAKNLIACYEDDAVIQNSAIDILQGKILPKGKLPVTICNEYKFGSGIAATVFFCPKQKLPLLPWEWLTYWV